MGFSYGFSGNQIKPVPENSGMVDTTWNSPNAAKGFLNVFLVSS